MRNITIFEVVLSLMAIYKSFWLGVLVIGYILYKNRDMIHLRQGSEAALKQLQAHWEQKHKMVSDHLKAIQDEVREEDDIPLEFKKPAEMPQRFVNYGNYLIEDYGGWYVVLQPDMQPYPKMFHNIGEAKKIVDRLVLENPQPKPKRSKIHNVRFVK